MAVFGWPDLGKLNRVTEEQRGVAASGKNARGLRPRWAPGASRPGTGIMVGSIPKSPCPGTGPGAPMPRSLRVLCLLLPRRWTEDKASPEEGNESPQPRAQTVRETKTSRARAPEAERSRPSSTAQRPGRGGQGAHSSDGTKGQGKSSTLAWAQPTWSFPKHQTSLGLDFLLYKLGSILPSWRRLMGRMHVLLPERAC